jgi:hypothetical protein
MVQQPTKVTSRCNPLPPVGVQVCIFQKCNGCSLSTTACCIVLIKIARMTLGTRFPISWAKQIDNMSPVEPSYWQRRPSSGRIRHEQKNACTAETAGMSETLCYCFLFYEVNVIYFWQTEPVRNGLCDFSTVCIWEWPPTQLSFYSTYFAFYYTFWPNQVIFRLKHLDMSALMHICKG